MGATPEHERQSENAGNKSWPDRYRPTRLEDVALDPTVRQLVTAYLTAGRTHSLILHGPPATGKTTIAEIIATQLFGRENVLSVNGSLLRGIDAVRDRVIQFMKVLHFEHEVNGVRTRQAVVILSEADGLTAEAQAALKDPMECYADNTLIFFTTNVFENINDAIRSRCKVIEIGVPPLAERAKVLERILESEGRMVARGALLQFTQRYTDMRELLRAAQDSFAVYGGLRVDVDGAEFDFWPEPVDGAALLDDLAAAFRHYVALQPSAAEALALWVLFAHAHDEFGYSPILAVVSPVKRSGKTRLFTVLRQLVPEPRLTSHVSPATLFHMGGIADESRELPNKVPTRPPLTLLADEADTYLAMSEDIRGILDSGHTRRGASVSRMNRGEPTHYFTFYPKAIALIESGRTALPPTIADRSIVIPMRRRKVDEAVGHLRGDRDADDLIELRRRAQRWAFEVFGALREIEAQRPERIGDRTADNWSPLLTIAQHVGGDWPEKAKDACLALSGALDESGELLILLLRDIRDVFTSADAERLPTRVLLPRLREVEERPWRSMLDAYKLAQILRPLGIRSKALWGDGPEGNKATLRGYFLKDFADAFARHL